MTASSFSIPGRSLVALAITLIGGMTAATAQIASGTTGIDASGRYSVEVQACLDGNTQQDRTTCLTEARNAQADKKRGALEYTSANFASNALSRCDALSGEDRSACRARVWGLGSASGSVAGGGVLREVETVALPPGRNSVRIEPKTAGPVVVVPTAR